MALKVFFSFASLHILKAINDAVVPRIKIKLSSQNQDTLQDALYNVEKLRRALNSAKSQLETGDELLFSWTPSLSGNEGLVNYFYIYIEKKIFIA